MIGILVKENKLSVDAPAPVAGWANTDKHKITLKAFAATNNRF